MDNLQLGIRIQNLRKEKKLSMRKLAEAAGITPSMLSQIENEQVNPSVNTLRSIAKVLEIPLYELFKEKHDFIENPVVKPESRLIIGSREDPDVHYELLTRNTRGNIEFCIMVIPPEKSSYRDRQSHEGEEVAYMLSGEMVELSLGESVHVLRQGDSIRINPGVPHVWHNPANEPVQVIFAVTPPTF